MMTLLISPNTVAVSDCMHQTLITVDYDIITYSLILISPRMFRKVTSGYKVIGSEPSPYTNKVYSYLRYKNISFTNVPATFDIYNSLLTKKVGWPVVPVLGNLTSLVISHENDVIIYGP